MEYIFSFTATDATTYNVVFKDEAYRFTPADDGKAAFALSREHDEWKSRDAIDTNLREEAITALDNYLLQQN